MAPCGLGEGEAGVVTDADIAITTTTARVVREMVRLRIRFDYSGLGGGGRS